MINNILNIDEAFKLKLSRLKLSIFITLYTLTYPYSVDKLIRKVYEDI